MGIKQKTKVPSLTPEQTSGVADLLMKLFKGKRKRVAKKMRKI